MADGSITIDTKLDNTGLKKGVDNIENSFSKLKGTVAKVAGILGLSKLAKDGIQYNATIEQLSTSFEVMTGSASKAKDVVEELKRFGAETPYELIGLANTTQLLMQYGFTADDAIDTTKQLGDISQGSADKMTSIATGFAQMSSAGKVNLQDIKQMINGGFNPLQEISKSTGESMESLYDRVSKGTMSINEIKDSMQRATSVGGQFYQSMEKQSQTLNGQMSTLKDNFMEFLGNALQPISNVLKDYIIPAINDILTGGENLKAFLEEHQTAIIIITGIIGTLTVAIGAYMIAMNLSTIALGAYTAITTVATTVSTAFGAVMAFITSPITLVVVAIGALITIIVLLVKNWDTVKEKTLEIWEKIKTFLSETIDKIVNWFKELPYKIGYYIGELLGKIIQFGIDAKNWVTQKLPEIINNIVNWFKQLPSKIWNALVSALNNMVNWLNNMKSKAQEGARNVVNGIIQFFKDLPNNMLNIGRNVVEGLWNGIKNAKDWIVGKVKEFAKGILDGIKSALGIHSPSTVFRDKVGKFIALGVGEGFTKNISKVYSQMQNAVDTETAKLSSNLTASNSVDIIRNSNISATLDEINTDREITVNAITNLDGKVLTRAVNTVNARQRLAYGIG